MKITICGSAAFINEMEDVVEQLKNLGHEVKVIRPLNLWMLTVSNGIRRIIINLKKPSRLIIRNF